jgi:hypothetical protein
MPAASRGRSAAVFSDALGLESRKVLQRVASDWSRLALSSAADERPSSATPALRSAPAALIRFQELRSRRHRFRRLDLFFFAS